MRPRRTLTLSTRSPRFKLVNGAVVKLSGEMRVQPTSVGRYGSFDAHLRAARNLDRI